MVKWRSDFDLLIPGRRPAELRNLTKTGRGWLSRGLYIRISDDRIKARYNEVSQSSVAPTMKGQLVHEEQGTRVLGRIRWTGLVLSPVIAAAAAVGLVFLSVEGIVGHDPVSAIITGLATIGFALLAVLGFRTQDAAREDEESRLRHELLRAFAMRGRPVKQGRDEPLAVFQFYEDGSGVDAYVSLQAAEGGIEGFDVRNGEGDFFAVDGRAVEATIVGEWGQDVSLRVTDHHRSDELRARLAAALPVVGIDASLADSPLAAAQALIDAKWNARWPRGPVWLDRRLHGSKPNAVPPKMQS